MGAPVNLRQLDADLIKLGETVDGGTVLTPVNRLEEADGVMFLCPACYRKNGGPRGTHTVVCWRRGVDMKHRPGPGRWLFTGETVANLTLEPSVHLTSDQGCGAHFYIRHGDIV